MKESLTFGALLLAGLGAAAGLVHLDNKAEERFRASQLLLNADERFTAAMGHVDAALATDNEHRAFAHAVMADVELRRIAEHVEETDEVAEHLKRVLRRMEKVREDFADAQFERGFEAGLESLLDA